MRVICRLGATGHLALGLALAFSTIQCQAQPVDFLKHVNASEGFSVHYLASWNKIEPNEQVTKLLVRSPSQTSRCWITVVPNPMAKQEYASEIVRSLIGNRAGVEAELKKTYAQVYVSSIRAVQMAGQHTSALMSYVFRSKNYDASIIVKVMEAHVFANQSTYKVGCSEASTNEGFSQEYTGNSTPFMRSFQIFAK